MLPCRLLFLQVARSQKCNINLEMLNEEIEKYCTFMFWEANKNAEFGFIEELDDLLLEQSKETVRVLIIDISCYFCYYLFVLFQF